jgi:hypothetical protein
MDSVSYLCEDINDNAIFSFLNSFFFPEAFVFVWFGLVSILQLSGLSPVSDSLCGN